MRPSCISSLIAALSMKKGHAGLSIIKLRSHKQRKHFLVFLRNKKNCTKHSYIVTDKWSQPLRIDPSSSHYIFHYARDGLPGLMYQQAQKFRYKLKNVIQPNAGTKVSVGITVIEACGEYLINT